MTVPGLRSRAAAQTQPGFRAKLLPGRAPDAFWCARATVPSMQANASCGSPSATKWAMILSHTLRTAHRQNRRQAWCHSPNSAGIERHLAPLSMRQMIASTVRRSSRRGRAPRMLAALIAASN